MQPPSGKVPSTRSLGCRDRRHLSQGKGMAGKDRAATAGSGWFAGTCLSICIRRTTLEEGRTELNVGRRYLGPFSEGTSKGASEDVGGICKCRQHFGEMPWTAVPGLFYHVRTLDWGIHVCVAMGWS